MELEITLPGKKKVQAVYNGLTIMTDQPVASGGDGTAPSPFDLFIASIGTCAGYYVLDFCRTRDIATDEIRITQSFKRDPETKLIPAFNVTVHLPASFPDKYRKAVIKAAEQCTVKKHLQNPPLITVAVAE